MWKGKARDDNYGSGGADGLVLPLDMHVSSPYEALYTLPLQVGTPPQTLSVQIDTGSSDLWLASSSCSSQACKQTSGKLYDSSGSKPTGQPFDIQYVEGVVEGPIVWDTITVGGYEIDNQALAAASSVDSEPLSPYFSGIMGLALPLNSIISSHIPPTTSNAPDGAIWPSNLFSITPSSTSPSYRFLSLTLARPDGGDTVPSLLGIGRHPPQDVIKDPSLVEYASLASPPSAPSGTGPFYWQARLNKITVYEGGVRKEVTIAKGSTAVVDSGMPIILASENIANGIYGALGIGPGSDGQYYVPCTTPLNMSVTLDSRTEIPLHPLDLTFYGSSLSRRSPRSQARDVSSGVSNSCLGLIQSFPSTSTLTGIADIVLGVPFMRSVYTVMAYDPPDSDGIFPNISSGLSQVIRPRLGLLGLTDAETALDEFNTERVLGKPLSTQAGNNNNNNGGAGPGVGTGRTESSNNGGHKLSVGVEVLLGLIGFFVLCISIFGARWLWQRRNVARERKANLARGVYAGANNEDDEKGREAFMMQEAAFILARKSSRSSRYATAEDTLRSQKFNEYMKRRGSEYTDDTARTRVTDDDDALGKSKNVKPDGDSPEPTDHDIALQDRELGFRPLSGVGRRHPVFSYASADGDDTLIEQRPSSFAAGQDAEERRSLMPEYPPSPTHSRMSTTVRSPEDADFAVAVPLLAHTRSDSQVDGVTYPPSPFSPDFPIAPVERMPLGMGRPTSRARVGSIVRDNPQQQSSSSTYSVRSVSGPRPMSDRRSSSGSIGSMRHASGPAALLSSSPPLPTIPAIPPPPISSAPSANSSTTGLSGEPTVGHGSS